MGRRRRRRRGGDGGRRRRHPHVAVVAEDVPFFSGEPDGGEHVGPALAGDDAYGAAALVADVRVPVQEEEDDLVGAGPQLQQCSPAVDHAAAVARLRQDAAAHEPGLKRALGKLLGRLPSSRHGGRRQEGEKEEEGELLNRHCFLGNVAGCAGGVIDTNEDLRCDEAYL